MPSQHKHTHAYKIQLPQTFSIPHSYLLDWCGYLPGARCRLFAYGPADATAILKPHHLLLHLNPVTVPSYSGCPGKEAVKRVQ